MVGLVNTILDMNELLFYYISILVIGIYSVALLLIFFYSLTQANLLWHYVKSQKITLTPDVWNINKLDELPKVTVQLPLYNELYVVERLLDAIKKLKYPKELLQIQVLDDSTDESLALTKKIITTLRSDGIPIELVTRPTREGFKAGALKYGLDSATGEFIAIFDADFIPQPDWLLLTVPYFKDNKVGVVQTRWGHLNKDYSVLTKVQAFALDAHFTLEQVGRNVQNHFINFNGTAGLWRKECIFDAGNWEGDTLTEDLDLSYRAQLKHWKFKYLENVITPAELPVVISAIRSQQFRWNKGGAENFQKMIGRVWGAKDIPLATKIQATLHLLNSSMFLNVFIVAILSIPMLYIKATWGHLSWYFNLSAFFIVSTLIFFVCYWFIHKKEHGSGFKSFFFYCKRFLQFYTIAMGFSVHNSIAVLEGHARKRSAFIRTPKFNIQNLNDSWKGNKYLPKKVSFNTIIEGLFTLYFLFGMWSAFTVGEEGDFGLFPFHLLLFIGFGFVTIQS